MADRRLSRAVITLASCLLVAGCASSPSPSPENPTIHHRLEAEAFSGVALVARRGRVIHRRAYGLADASTGTPCEIHTALPTASLTKLFTQLAVLRLAEAGRLDLDDPVVSHRPAFQADVAGRVTLRQLLAMSSGLPRELHPDLRHSGVRFDQHGLAGPFLDDLTGLELGFPPGSSTSYSNLGYWLLGAIIETVHGTTYADALAELVWRPLELRATAFGPPSGAGHGHLRTVDGRLLAVTDPGIERRYASGAVYSTVDDLHRVCAALTAGRLLSRTSLETLEAGFSEDRSPATATIVLTGHQPGIASFFACNVDDGSAIILLGNHRIEPPDRIGRLASDIARLMR